MTSYTSTSLLELNWTTLDRQVQTIIMKDLRDANNLNLSFHVPSTEGTEAGKIKHKKWPLEHPPSEYTRSLGGNY